MSADIEDLVLEDWTSEPAPLPLPGDLDPTVEELVADNYAWLAGGAVRALFVPEIPADYDLFFWNELGLWTTGQRLFEAGFTCTYACPDGKLYSYLKKGEGVGKDVKVQCIAERYYDEPEDVIDRFDVVAGCAVLYNETPEYDNMAETVICHPGFLASLQAKALTLHRITYPASTLKRIAKYARKGYFLSTEAAQHFVTQIRETDFTEEDWLRGYID